MEPIRCLIVDDESLTIERLSMFFEKLMSTNSSFVLIGKAYSGDEGLELAAQLRPDIVITDIRMPGMDGIAMIELMKPIIPEARFIILSAYSDFEFAQRAIHLNVQDYIIKVPLNEDDLLQAMEKSATDLLSSRSKNERLRQLNTSFLENRNRIFKQFFRELFSGEIRTKQAKEIGSSFDMLLFQDHYCCIVIEMNRYIEFINRYPLSEQRLLKYGILNIFEETIQQFGEGLAAEVEQHQFIGFIHWPNLTSEFAQEKKYREIGQMIINNISIYLEQDVSVSFSRPHKGWTEIIQSYNQAMRANELQYYQTPNHIMTPSFLTNRQNEENSQTIQVALEDMLSSLYRIANLNEIRSVLDRFKLIAMEDSISRLELTHLIKRFLQATKIRRENLNKNINEIEEDVLDFMSLDEQLEYLHNFMAISSLHEGTTEREEIAKAISYIEDRLSERLSLQQIAKHVNLAPAYFSSLFKKEMGENLVDFINRKKIEAAVELLISNTYTNQELAERVGILNEAYFCTLFKQKTGFTPQQYRKQSK